MGIGRLLFMLGMLIAAFGVAPQAQAQNPRLAIAEVEYSLAGSDNTREYFEIANLGTAAWDPNNSWLFRQAPEDTPAQIFVRITGVDPIPAGGVLLVEWGRPIPEVAGTTKGNVFVTTRRGVDSTGAGVDFNSGTDELRANMTLAVFAPTTNNAVPSIANGTMLAFLAMGTLDSLDKAASGYTRAVALGLWKDGDIIASAPDIFDWVLAMRMHPGAYPINHGQSSADYYWTLSNVPALNDAGLNTTSPLAAAPNTMNRAGTPGLPNYLHPAPPIPGQIDSEIFAARVVTTPATVALNTPATGVAVAAVTSEGFVATNLLTSNQWAPWTLIIGPPADQVTLLDNAKQASRTLILRSKATGGLFGSTQSIDTGNQFYALRSLGVRAQFAPATVADSTGAEYYAAVEVGSGKIFVNRATSDRGTVTLGPWVEVTGITANAQIAVQALPDPVGIAIATWNNNQLQVNFLGSDGKLAGWQNVGAAVSGRPAGQAPVLLWNASAKRVEVLALVGTAPNLEVHHARVEITTAREVKPGALTRIPNLTTNAAVAAAVNPDSGQIRLLARGGGGEPTNNPRDGQQGVQNGFVLVSTFNGTAWSALQRVGLGRLPGPSAATPRFTVPVAPATLFDVNTKRFNDVLTGEDGQIYHIVVAP
jgi:hypothetical protein